MLIILPDHSSFFHALARVSGYKEYRSFSVNRDDLIEKLRQELAMSLDLPSNPLYSTMSNYEAFVFARSKEEVRNEILEAEDLPSDLVNYISTYLGIGIEMTGDESYVMLPDQMKYKIVLHKSNGKYSLVGKLAPGKILTTKF